MSSFGGRLRMQASALADIPERHTLICTSHLAVITTGQVRPTGDRPMAFKPGTTSQALCTGRSADLSTAQLPHVVARRDTL